MVWDVTAGYMSAYKEEEFDQWFLQIPHRHWKVALVEWIRLQMSC